MEYWSDGKISNTPILQLLVCLTTFHAMLIIHVSEFLQPTENIGVFGASEFAPKME